MGNLSGFDASQVGDMQNFDNIPEGDYVALLVKSEEKDTKDGTSKYLSFEFEIVDGPYKSRKLWTNLNLFHHKQQVVDIAQRELGSICKAVGVLRPQDSSELHGIPLVIKVGFEKRKDTGEMQNKIKGYAAVGGSSVRPQQQAAQPQRPPQQAQSPGPSWSRPRQSA